LLPFPFFFFLIRFPFAIATHEVNPEDDIDFTTSSDKGRTFASAYSLKSLQWRLSWGWSASPHA
jgi:hypothetical protein